MSRSTKALLLSLLLFPASGLFLLRRPWQGAALGAVAAVALYALLDSVLRVAEGLSAQLLSGELPLQPGALLAALHAASAQVGEQAQLASLLFLGCWLVGLLLTYRASEAG